MKRFVLMLMCLALILPAAVSAEENIFETLSGLTWCFSSGAGGWSTDLEIRADGSFVGEYHDSEMGDCTDEYPDGTVYFCAFSGRLSLAEQVDDNTWKIRVEQLEKEEGQEAIEDGMRFVPSDIYGLSEGDEMLLYRPGTPVSVLSDEMQMWAHLFDMGDMPTELEYWFLSSEKNDSGFVGYKAE